LLVLGCRQNQVQGQQGHYAAAAAVPAVAVATAAAQCCRALEIESCLLLPLLSAQAHTLQQHCCPSAAASQVAVAAAVQSGWELRDSLSHLLLLLLLLLQHLPGDPAKDHQTLPQCRQGLAHC
jgi:hypothetical protein